MTSTYLSTIRRWLNCRPRCPPLAATVRGGQFAVVAALVNHLGLTLKKGRVTARHSLAKQACLGGE